MLNFYDTPSIFGSHFRVFDHLLPNILEISGISGMDLKMWAAVLGDFLFPSRRTAGNWCKIFSKMNLQFFNIIIGDAVTNLADFFYHLLAVLREKYRSQTF